MVRLFCPCFARQCLTTSAFDVEFRDDLDKQLANGLVYDEVFIYSKNKQER